MKKAIALILSLMLVLCIASAAMAETATVAEIKVDSVDAFLGEWTIAGVLLGGSYFTIEEWSKLQGQSTTAKMDLTIKETTLVLSSGGQSASAPISLNAEGYLNVSDNSGAGSVRMREDGTIVFYFDSNDNDNSYAGVFAKK